MKLDRRSFLIGLFGTAAVVAAGPIPEAINKLSNKDFMDAVKSAFGKADEVYGNGRDYAFATVRYINKPPYFEVTIPEGYRPLREESDRIGVEAINKMLGKK